ncbi:hypothetical protein GQ600_13076 [Phytophthora cactorum]|nr:hypothetical protein GQ600_13076 [Phytophthora cactorum]
MNKAADTDKLLAGTDRILRQLNDAVSSSSDGSRAINQPVMKNTNPLRGRRRVGERHQPIEEATGLAEKNQTEVGQSWRLVRRKRRAISISSEEDDATERRDESADLEVVSGNLHVSTSVKSKGRLRHTKAKTNIRITESLAESYAPAQETLVTIIDLSFVQKTIPRSPNVTDARIKEVNSPIWSASSIMQLARKQKVHQKVTITLRKSLRSEHDAGRVGASKKLGMPAETTLITHDRLGDFSSWVKAPKRYMIVEYLCYCEPKGTSYAIGIGEHGQGDTNPFWGRSGAQTGVLSAIIGLEHGWLPPVISHPMDKDKDSRGQSRTRGVKSVYARTPNHESANNNLLDMTRRQDFVFRTAKQLVSER